MSVMKVLRQKSYYIKIVLVIIGVVLMCARYMSAQVVHYSFDNCDGTDETLLQIDADLQGGVNCSCGLKGQSAILDGVNDRVILPNTLQDVFDDDFSLEFYFQIEPSVGINDILSFSTTCSFDSTFSVRYLNSSGEIVYSLSENINARVESRAVLNQSNCWHHFLLVKSGLEYNFFLDNEFISTTIAPKGLSIGKNAIFGFSTSPCLGVNEERFTGVVEEFKIYDRAISRLEANSLYLFPGLIANRDTTIFVGESVDLSAGTNCASNVSWTPTAGLTLTNNFNTTATPDISTTYVLTTVTNDGCTQIDSVRINVISDDEIACEKLLLPKAFTPNGDQLNDIYRISNNFIVESLQSFEIFDRWGTRVFVTDQVNEGWDGYFNGTAVNPGLYIYKISYTCLGSEYSKLDNFTVLR